MCLCVLFCFFFQAEDGIRDLTVTGVQTCALPISAQAVNVLDLADLAARNIAEALGKRATTVAESELSQSALAHYVEGKRLLEGWDVESNYSRAAEAFLRAIDAQEDFAEAHAGLALA